MPQVTREGQVVETAREARGAEPGPSMLVVLTVSTVAVAALFAVIWLLLLR
jgi:hypothetical protein